MTTNHRLTTSLEWLAAFAYRRRETYGGIGRVTRSLFGIVVAAIVANYSRGSTAKPGPREVEVVGSDYALTLPGELPPGPTTFHFRNNGKVYHEMVIFVLKPEVAIDEFVRTAAEQKPLSPLTESAVGILFSRPGKRSSTALSTEL